MSEWISVVDELPPNYENTKQTFLAIWLDTGEIDGIEWYSWCGGDSYYNLNSNNLNHFGGEKQMKLFSHWMPMLDAPDEGNV